MQVKIKDFTVDMEIKNKGMEIGVFSPQGKHRGDLIVTKTSLIWCSGRTSRKNGVKVSWNEFIKWMES